MVLSFARLPLAESITRETSAPVETPAMDLIVEEALSILYTQHCILFDSVCRSETIPRIT